MIRHRQLARQPLDHRVVADEGVADARADDARLVADDRVAELGVLDGRPTADRDVRPDRGVAQRHAVLDVDRVHYPDVTTQPRGPARRPALLEDRTVGLEQSVELPG